MNTVLLEYYSSREPGTSEKIALGRGPMPPLLKLRGVLVIPDAGAHLAPEHTDQILLESGCVRPLCNLGQAVIARFVMCTVHPLATVACMCIMGK